MFKETRKNQMAAHRKERLNKNLNNRPEQKSGQRIDLPIREIRSLFEQFKGIRISNRLAYQIQEALAKGEGEQVGPVIEIDGLKIQFSVNGLPGLSSLRRLILFRCLNKSRTKEGLIDLGYTAKFLQLMRKGTQSPVERLRRHMMREGVTISSDKRDVRLMGGLMFEELCFDFETPEDGLDISKFGPKLLRAVYEYHDCDVQATAQFFHTDEQLMWGILKRAGVEFKTPEVFKHFQLPSELEKKFGPAIQKQIRERLRIPITEILRIAKARAGRKKIANRRYLDTMEQRIKNFIELVLVPEFGVSVLNEENAKILHAGVWHFLQWEIGQLPVEDILNLEVVSPYEMMFSRILRTLGVTERGCPTFFNKDYSTKNFKPYSPIIVTQETLYLLFRYFKTADLLESSGHASVIEEGPFEKNPKRALLEIELKHLQRFPIEMDTEQIKEQLQRAIEKINNVQEFYGMLSVEIKQILAALQDLIENQYICFFGIDKENRENFKTEIQHTINKIQHFIKGPARKSINFQEIELEYLSALKTFDSLCKNYPKYTREGRAQINTWASLSEIYRIIFGVKGLDPPKRKRKRSQKIKHHGFPLLRFGPELHEILPGSLIRATFVFPSDAFEKINLIPPHLRSFFIIDEPDNHMGQFHMAAWAFRIHWKRRRLGKGQKAVADSYIRSLRFLRAFVYRPDNSSKAYLICCNCDNDFFGKAKVAGNGTVLEKAKKIAREALGLSPSQILEINQAEEPASEHDKLAHFEDLIESKT